MNNENIKGKCQCPYKNSCHPLRQQFQCEIREKSQEDVTSCDFFNILKELCEKLDNMDKKYQNTSIYSKQEIQEKFNKLSENEKIIFIKKNIASTVVNVNVFELLSVPDNVICKMGNNSNPEVALENIYCDLVFENANFIRLIKKPSLRVQLEAIKQNPYSIRFIKEPFEEVQLEAVRREPKVIEFIENPSEEVQLLTISLKPFCVEYIKSPTLLVQLTILEEKPHLLKYIKHLDREIEYKILKNKSNNTHLMQFIENPSLLLSLNILEF